MNDTTPERQRAARVQEGYRARRLELGSNADLTPEARTRHLAEAWAKARRELDDLQAAERTRLTQRERALAVP